MKKTILSIGFKIVNKKMKLNSNDLEEEEEEQLILVHTDLSKAEIDFSNFTNLKEIYLGNNNLEKIPDSVCLYNKIERLTYNENLLVSLPSHFLNLNNLKLLNLCNNSIETIPSEIFRLESLEKLDLGMNCIKEIRFDLRNLNKLKVLNLYNNSIEIIPIEIFNLESLEELDLGMNHIKDVQFEIRNLKNLKKLYLNDNQIEELSEIFNLESLEELHLKNNNIKYVQVEIRNLKNLKQLYLHDNQIEELPESIGELINLEKIVILRNKLITLPASIQYLVNLQELNIYKNNIMTLPSEMIELRKLERFIYDSNIDDIKTLPRNVKRLLLRTARKQNNIYQDSESSQNSGVTRSILKSVQYLLSIPLLFTIEEYRESISKNIYLTEISKSLLLEYIEFDDMMYNKSEIMYNQSDVTFQDILLHLYSRIESHEFKEEIYKIINYELRYSQYVCHVGKFTKLLNCLSGFDEMINITMPDNERIGNIIVKIKKELEIANIYSIDAHRDLSFNILIAEGYDKDVIDLWIENIE